MATMNVLTLICTLGGVELDLTTRSNFSDVAAEQREGWYIRLGSLALRPAQVQTVTSAARRLAVQITFQIVVTRQ